MHFSEILINWYLQHKRDLPWRNTKNPYFIWLSEVILQQTRVDQGLPYYLNFIHSFPTVSDLALADENQVLKLWQGLGYYSRARNLHFTARLITNEHNGIFPNNYIKLKELKGVGDYTAAAIASFAYNLPHPVVDGNVFRFFSRLFDINTPIDSLIGKKQFLEVAKDLMDAKRPDLFNQATMEFGATICTPKQPSCALCPFAQNCLALKHNSIDSRPVKAKKTKQKERFFHYLHLKSNDWLFVQKRTGQDIWKNLYEFPLIELKSREKPLSILKHPFFKELTGVNWDLIKVSLEYKHILSHQIIYAVFYEIEIKEMKNLPKELKSIHFDTLNQFPIPRLIDKYLNSKATLETL
ncbi:MAG: A/G-specific adenine glycosylase [Bacteroidetes bacterium]|nr:A/G-specific adenine glycosylase [Bacteroidota bacterium]HET6244192.1 A/G-specific adenine glycosylase [Bacteroidia bacterium]